VSTARSSQNPSQGRAARAAVPSWAIAAGALGAVAAYAHRELLFLRPGAALEVPLSADVEAWFFEPSDTSPGLVLAFVAWLLYRRSGRLARCFGQPGPLALTALLFAAGLGVFYWAVRTAAHDLQAIAVFFELLAVCHAFGGRPALRIVGLPAAVLVFALPVPAPLLNEVVWRFQLWTAEYSGLLLHLLGQPALVSGDQILRSDQVFQIIETCSGLRTAETLSLLAVLMVDLFRRRGVHAGVLIVAALPVAFVINGFRALTLIFNPHSDVAAVHNLQGILMLLCGVLLLYGLDGLLERFLPQRTPSKPAVPRAVEGDGPPLRSAWLATGAAVLALLTLSIGLDPWRPKALRPGSATAQLPHQLEGWQGTDFAADRMFLGLANFSQILSRDYVRGRDRLNVFVGVAGLRLRYRSFHTPKTALPATGWIVEQRRRERRDDGWLDVQLVRKGTVRLLVHHWRQAGGGIARETLRSALALDMSPFQRSEVPVVVRLATPVSARPEGLEAGQRRLDEFARMIGPSLKDIGVPRGDRAASTERVFSNFPVLETVFRSAGGPDNQDSLQRQQLGEEPGSAHGLQTSRARRTILPGVGLRGETDRDWFGCIQASCGGSLEPPGA
jgi:exosortase